jgi:hypothetical protein
VSGIRSDPLLSEAQKKTLVHIYETFRAERLAELGAEDGGRAAVAMRAGG